VGAGYAHGLNEAGVDCLEIGPAAPVRAVRIARDEVTLE